jgi:hypothetical protein
MTFLSFSLSLGLLLCLICLGFQIQTLCFCVVDVLIAEGRLRNQSGQCLGLIVMNNSLAEV